MHMQAVNQSEMANAPLIILIDDEPMDLYIIERAIKKISPLARIHSFPSSTACIEWLDQTEQCQPTLVLSDANLVQETGMDVLQKFKDHAVYKDTPFLLMSGNMTDEMRSAAMTAGAHSCVEKSMSWDDLKDKIEGIVAQFEQPAP